MIRPIPKKWLAPFRLSPELGATDYEAAFTPPLPRRTALNRLNRLREAGLVDRLGETRATVYLLTDAGRAKLEKTQALNTEPQAGPRLSVVKPSPPSTRETSPATG